MRELRLAVIIAYKGEPMARGIKEAFQSAVYLAASKHAAGINTTRRTTAWIESDEEVRPRYRVQAMSMGAFRVLDERILGAYDDVAVFHPRGGVDAESLAHDLADQLNREDSR